MARWGGVGGGGGSLSGYVESVVCFSHSSVDIRVLYLCIL